MRAWGCLFLSCPLALGLSMPRKSGHTRSADLTIIQHGGWCPDLSGSACALLIGNAVKKDIPMLMRLTNDTSVALRKDQK